MSAALDMRDAECQDRRAKWLHRSYSDAWTRIEDQRERNSGHACAECGGRGFDVESAFSPLPCDDCGATGDARVKAPAMVMVIHNAMTDATFWVLPARVILDSIKHARLMERIAMNGGGGDSEDYGQEWPEDEDR